MKHRNYWVGCGYGTNQSLVFDAGVILGLQHDWKQAIKIGYAFRYSMGSVRRFFGGSHEINVNFLLD